MTEEEIVNAIVKKLPGNENLEGRTKLVHECWKSLDKDAQNALKTQLNISPEDVVMMSPKISIEIEGKVTEINGINQFIESMSRLERSFGLEKIDEAVTNFKFVDRSKFTTEQSLFDGYNNNLTEEFNSNEDNLKKFDPVLKKLGPNIATAVSSYTVKSASNDISGKSLGDSISEDETSLGGSSNDNDNSLNKKRLAQVIKQLTVGIITDKNTLLHSRSLDEKIVNKDRGTMNSELAMAVTGFAVENMKHLAEKPAKEIRAIGGQLKKACLEEGINISEKNKGVLHPIVKAVNKVSKGLTR